MNIETISAFLAATLTFVISLSVILRDREQRSYLTFFKLCINVAGCFLCHGMAITLSKPTVHWLTMAFAAAIPLNSERFFARSCTPTPMQHI